MRITLIKDQSTVIDALCTELDQALEANAALNAMVVMLQERVRWLHSDFPGEIEATWE